MASCTVPSDRVTRLPQVDNDLIRSSLALAVAGPYFPDWEFSILFGLSREEVAHVLAAWPEAAVVTSWESDPDRVQEFAVQGVLNNLLGHPHGEWELLSSELGISKAEFRSLFDRWQRRSSP